MFQVTIFFCDSELFFFATVPNCSFCGSGLFFLATVAWDAPFCDSARLSPFATVALTKVLPAGMPLVAHAYELCGAAGQQAAQEEGRRWQGVSAEKLATLS